MNYCAGFIRQQENQQLGWTEAVRELSPTPSGAVGYSIYNGLIGHIDKEHPGKRLLRTDEDANLVWDLARSTPPSVDVSPPAELRRRSPDREPGRPVPGRPARVGTAW